MTARPSTKRMKIYSPFEGGWRVSARGMFLRQTQHPPAPASGRHPLFKGDFQGRALHLSNGRKDATRDEVRLNRDVFLYFQFEQDLEIHVLQA